MYRMKIHVLKRLSTLIALITAMLTVSIAVPAHAQDISWTGSGTQESPYEIDNHEKLAAIATQGLDKHYKLTQDITVASWGTNIGSTDAPFTGSFDGSGYVITLTGSTSLFGQVGKSGETAGTVKNLGVDAKIDGYTDYIGAIARSSYGTIQYCFVKGSIESSKDYLGGIVGQNVGTIEDCYTTVSIKATGIVKRVGGIAGLNNKSNSNVGTIQRCYATGAVNNINTNFGAGAGGIVGQNSTSAGTTIKNCIALNESITGNTAGRIIISNYGGNDALADNYASPLIPGTWAEKEVGKKDGADLTEGNFITNATTEGGAFYGWNNGNTAWDFTTPANLPTLTGFKDDQPVKDITRESTITKLLITEIKNADDLATFRDAVNSGETYEGKIVTLANDITVTGWATGIGIEESNKDNNKPFSGTFDGQGYMITLTGSANLFTIIGKANETYGTVKNLGVNAEITANGTNIGGIVGHNYGTIQNCYTKGTITNDSYYTGGIAGYNEGTIQNCYSTASCTGNDYTGGIVGKHSGTILQCYATGAINGKSSAGGIAATWQGSNIPLKNCIALNTSITFTNTGGKSGRIISSSTASFLSNNHASPLIPGEWSNKGADGKDGADLTDDNFIDTGSGASAFTDWQTAVWDFTDPDKLPKLKTTENIVIAGQGNMPARADFLEKVIEIATAVTYDAATHKGKQIHVLDKGIFTVNADGVSFKKLTIEEGGQVVANTTFTCNELLAPRTLGNKWTAYGSPVDMKAVATTNQTFHRLSGYKNTSNQSWSSSGSSTTASYPISKLNLIATEAADVSVTLTAPASGSDPVTIPADVAAATGEALYTGQFLFCANPTLKNVTIPMAYILSDDGTRFERTENAVVKLFQSYMVANAATSATVLSLRAGGIPTAYEPVTLPDGGFRLWGSNGQLHLSADTPSDVAIYDLSGRLIRRITLNGDQTLSLGSGIYLVNSNNITYKVSL